MEQVYHDKMKQLGYDQLICDIFTDWEDVKDEILLKERKSGTGSGTVHVFLGAADDVLKREFASYYNAVDGGEDPSVGAVQVRHFFLANNVLSMIGYLCRYYQSRNLDYSEEIKNILSELNMSVDKDGLISAVSLFKLSIGSNKLRPYFKQFDESGAFYRIIRHLLQPQSAYKISLYKNIKGEYAAFWLIGFDYLLDFEASSSKAVFGQKQFEQYPLQKIYYGTPGSGKSHKVKEIVEGLYPEEQERDKYVFRTTFHPDSDYASFVGCYKPQMDETGDIKYEFTPQAFTNAYARAWKESEKQVYLVIEEINRGNCAQIFGDLFQLLDRKGGVSEYPINADTDLRQYLEKDDILGKGHEGIANGKLKLPANLNIVATMNTSDQSLFPMDSAFKRRWSWECVPINYDDDKSGAFAITIGNLRYKWLEFLKAVNKKIFKATDSEDKQMGNFFINGDVEKRQFIDKVMFYLWNDICKEEYRTTNNFFRIFVDDKKIETTEFSFNELFGTNAETLLKGFMVFLGVESIQSEGDASVTETKTD